MLLKFRASLLRQAQEVQEGFLGELGCKVNWEGEVESKSAKRTQAFLMDEQPELSQGGRHHDGGENGPVIQGVVPAPTLLGFRFWHHHSLAL